MAIGDEKFSNRTWIRLAQELHQKVILARSTSANYTCYPKRGRQSTGKDTLHLRFKPTFTSL